MPDANVILKAAGAAGALLLLYYFRRQREKCRSLERANAELQEKISRQDSRSSAERSELNVILSSMVEGVLVIGRDEKIQYISPNLSAMFDFRSKEVTARPYWEMIPHAQVISAIKESIASAGAISREITLFQVEDVVFNIQVSPVLNNGALMGAVVVFHDISALKKLLKMRSEFVANVSHELKTPLTSIKGYVETLSEPGGMDDKETIQKFLKVIHKQTLRLEALVKDLLTISSIESKEVAMDLQPCDVAALVNNTVNSLKNVIDAARHKVVLNIAPQLPMIIVDRSRMEQVLVNLLENAVKFAPAGGTIEIAVKEQEPYVAISVTDSGIGIAPEHLPRLFERFYRVDKSRSSELGGTGLGLAIVKHIVLAHQGRVDVKSKPGSGTTFTIFLPVSKN